jgi:hypothetical protein
VRLPPGGELAYEPADWTDALVVVEEGEIEIECRDGGFRRFACGAVLSLTGLPLRTLHNRGSDPVLLSAVSRRPDEKMEP